MNKKHLDNKEQRELESYAAEMFRRLSFNKICRQSREPYSGGSN